MLPNVCFVLIGSDVFVVFVSTNTDVKSLFMPSKVHILMLFQKAVSGTTFLITVIFALKV